MSRRLGTLSLLLAATLTLGACGYFNSLYNAQRRFSDAERSARRGEREAANSAYLAAIEKAAISYRNHPDSRWADDALLLVARARFALGQHAAARAALARVLEQSADPEVRAVAALHLGAALAALGQPDSALVPLAQGLERTGRGSEFYAFGRLWQGRARLASGDPQGWSDLETAAAAAGRIGVDAALELGTRALETGDSLRTAAALARLAELRAAELRVDTIAALLRGSAARFSPALVASWLPERAAEAWSAEPRTRLRTERARLTAAAGDTAAAVRAVLAAAQHSGGAAGAAAREQAAHWLIAGLEEPDGLAAVRAALLPAVAHAGPVAQIRRVRTLELLLERARAGQAVALFAAGEFARDSLHAPRLARGLFLAYADVAGAGVWAPKALLAALALSPEPERAPLVERVRNAAGNPYVQAVTGEADSAAFQQAEARLGRAVGALLADAVAVARTGDVRVTRAITVLDSLRLLARADSLRLRCGGMLDSLALRGVRSDSVRAACLRGDSAGVARYLAVDTLLLRARAPGDSARSGRVTPRDTLDL